jgi:predicted metal-dependent HD superfamily phosphohydrolase
VEQLLADCVDALVSAGAGAGAPVAQLEGAAQDLLRRWSEPHRGYHDVRHLAEVLNRLRELAAAGVAAAATPEVRLAAWFHDAVYDGSPGADEEASALLAHDQLLALSVPDTVSRRVCELVRVTAAHAVPAGDAGAAALCDADLAVLAADPDRYADYVAGVRREYAALDDATFRAGRAAVLRRLLDRPALFTTEVARQWWEQAARANVSRELSTLD